jgi:hypothetical protein
MSHTLIYNGKAHKAQVQAARGPGRPRQQTLIYNGKAHEGQVLAARGPGHLRQQTAGHTPTRWLWLRHLDHALHDDGAALGRC